MSDARLEIAERWFASRGWHAFEYQREVWRRYLAGESGLIHAATGTGKTLAAWLGPLLEHVTDRDTAAAPPLTVLWLTPLRALAADTTESLMLPLRDLAPHWTLESRTGDTTAAVRARQRKRLPTALVTTPESATLLLARDDAPSLFDHLDLVVVDEWHELMGTKRGVQVELALSRLRALRPTLRTWGLSATIGNLPQASDALLGVGMPGAVVEGEQPKQVVIDAIIPPVIERFPWAGHLGTQLVGEVVGAIEEANTAIVFTNTRSQTEIWYRAILEQRPDWSGIIALHHGSLEPATRAWVEEGLRNATLRCVVATSSLDLGVDFSPVDRVLQVGSPKGIARLLQRAGRSGHRPGQQSRVTCVPTQVLELVEIAAARDGVEGGHVEARLPVERPLDVLVQHVITAALGGGFRSEELLREVRSTRSYAGLRDDEWAWVLDFASRGGEALSAYPEYARLVERDGRYTVDDEVLARRHRMTIGTIVSDAQVTVQYMNGSRLGGVEESFAARLRPGDRFIFAGKPLEFLRVRDMTVWVKRAPSMQGAIPRWMGTRLPISDELAAALRARLDEAARGIFRGAEMQAVRPVLEIQARWSCIPREGQLLIEQVKSREGFHLFIFPFEGRLVHEGLAALFAWRLSQLVPISFSMSSNDYGFELLSAQPPPLADALEGGLLSPRSLVDHLPAALNASEMARRQFREIARVSGLVFPGLPRAGKTARQLQASSGLFFDVLQRYDPDNLLLAQAHREVLERQLERSRLGRTLERLSGAEVALTTPKRTPPLAFPLLVDRTRERVSSESWSDRVRRMQLVLEKAAG
ncbi:MAG: box helicase protein [Gemmatimonadetes bacterium]|nr:box helicase protein [Gemmatimonadota bacterium]